MGQQVGVSPCLPQRTLFQSEDWEARWREEPEPAVLCLTHESNLSVALRKEATDLIETQCAVRKPLFA